MKILLLAGGKSSEREVSLASGMAVYKSLRGQDHIVYAIDPASGKSLVGTDGNFITGENSEPGKQVNTSNQPIRKLGSTLESPGFSDIDVVFIALHGGTGENGSIQCLVELAGKKYTGSSMTASAIAMDKAITKRLIASEGITTADWELYRFKEVVKAQAVRLCRHRRQRQLGHSGKAVQFETIKLILF